MSRVTTDPYEKAMKRHGFSEEFRSHVLEARRIERAARLRAQEIVRARRAMSVHSVPQWVRELVMTVAAEYDVSPSDVYSPSQRRPIVAARNDAIYRAKQTKPQLSSQQLGTWFCRDAKTVLHSLASHQHLHGLPRLTEYNLVAQRERSMAWYFTNPRPARRSPQAAGD